MPLIDGIVAGVWHQRGTGRWLDITAERFDPLTATQRRGLHDQMERMGAFLSAHPRLTLGTVSVGALA